MATTLRLDPALQARFDAARARLLVQPTKQALLQSLINAGLTELEKKLDAGLPMAVSYTAPAEPKPGKPAKSGRGRQ